MAQVLGAITKGVVCRYRSYLLFGLLIFVVFVTNSNIQMVSLCMSSKRWVVDKDENTACEVFVWLGVYIH